MYKLFIEKNVSSNEFLKLILNKVYKISNYEVIYNKYHKPYLKDSNIYFNISHDKGTTVLVVSDKEIGVDIEYLTYKEDVIKHRFNKKEQLIIENSLNKEYDFTRIWVMKEAYVKCLGIGLEYGLKNVDTTKLSNQIDILNKDTYLIAVCESEV